MKDVLKNKNLSIETYGVIFKILLISDSLGYLKFKNGKNISTFLELQKELNISEGVWRRLKKDIDALNIIERIKYGIKDYTLKVNINYNNTLHSFIDIKEDKNYIYRLFNTKNEIVYIGKTKNIINRIKQHKNNKNFSFFDYAEVSDSEVGIYEQYYINRYKPIMNIEGKGYSTLMLNLPELIFIK